MLMYQNLNTFSVGIGHIYMFKLYQAKKKVNSQWGVINVRDCSSRKQCKILFLLLALSLETWSMFRGVVYYPSGSVTININETNPTNDTVLLEVMYRLRVNVWSEDCRSEHLSR